MENFIPIGILVLLIGGAIFYIFRAKKSGAKCVGCPHAKSCKSRCCCQSDDPEEN